MNGPNHEESPNPHAGNQSRPRGLPLQNVVLATFVIAAVAGAAEATNAATGFPLGQRTFGGSDSSGVFLFSAGAQAVVCAVAVLSARGVAKLLLPSRRSSRRYGYWLLVLSAALATLPLVSLDLFATRAAHWWQWENDVWHWQGIALPNLAGWLLVNAAASLAATPALIDKRPLRPPPTLRPLAVWFALNLALLAGCASRASDAALAVLAALVALATALAFQHQRGAVANCGVKAGRE